MERGTYVAASGGLLELRKLDVVNNNLANINTPGFKKQLIVGETQSFEQTLASLSAQNDPYARPDHLRTPGTVNIKTVTDFSQGPIKNTGNKFDLALRNANDFFAVNTADGIQYTRAGNFTMDQTGKLVTADGYPVQGDGGDITIEGVNISIASDGRVLSNNQVIGQVQVVRVTNPNDLERVGASRFKLVTGVAAPAAVDNAEVIPQSLEMSNVSAISSVIDLITANRGFDLYTKSAKSIDDMNQMAISQVGKSR